MAEIIVNKHSVGRSLEVSADQNVRASVAFAPEPELSEDMNLDARLYEKLDREYENMVKKSVAPKPKPVPLPPGKETHAMRHRKQQTQHVAKENQRLFQRLQDIWREPPAHFHAPQGPKSVKQGKLVSVQPKQVRGDEWPAAPPSDYAFTKGLKLGKSRAAKQREREIAKENEILRQKILEPFKGRSGYKSYAETMGTKPVKAEAMWVERLSHYEDTKRIIPRRRPGTAPVTESQTWEAEAGDEFDEDGFEMRAQSGLRASTAEANIESEMDRMLTQDRTVKRRAAPTGVKVSAKGIPKTLAMGSCQGCGKKSFYLGDGRPLFKCAKCEEVFYCSKACQEIDWAHHRTLCTGGSKATGSWNPYGGVASETMWVANGAMAEARRLLRKKEAIWGEGNDTRAVQSIKRRYGEMRQREAMRDAEQGLVEQLQELNMNGPRPCMHYPKTGLA